MASKPTIPGQAPRKRFGQNFLHDRHVIDRIVAAVNPQPHQHLVEIGPGRGALTGGLLASGARLQAIELDRDLLPWLKLHFGLRPNFELIAGDVLKVDFGALRDDTEPLRVVGNLPYNISTPVLFHLLRWRDAVADMHFMLQHEVVQRLAAVPGSKAYGKLSVMVQYHCRVQPLFEVAPGSFTPPPKVYSAVVRLQVHPQLPFPARDERLLETVVSTAFQQRRKTLRNALSALADEAMLAAAGIDSRMRAEQIPLPEYVALANFIYQSRAQ